MFFHKIMTEYCIIYIKRKQLLVKQITIYNILSLIESLSIKITNIHLEKKKKRSMISSLINFLNLITLFTRINISIKI